MPVTTIVRPILLLLTAALLCGAAGGCATTDKRPKTPPMRTVLRVTNHVGGTHYRTIVAGDRWYQTFGNQLLVINPRSLRVTRELELSPFGTTGPASDLTMANGDLFVVLRHDEILQVSVEREDDPVIVQRVNAAQLGFDPRWLSVVNEGGDEHVYVCGEGGAKRFPDGPVLLRGKTVRSIARADVGLVGTVDRRVYSVADESYIGSATTLQPIPGDDRGMMIFTRRGSTGVLIGLMESSVRERSASKSTTAVSGDVHRVRWFDGSIWIVGDEEILAYTPTEQGLDIREIIRVKGARDVDMLRDNYLAVAGTFGRAAYRIESDDSGPGDTFLGVQREPSRLSVAISDQMSILAGSPAEGMWMYRIGSEAEMSDKVMTKDVPSSRSAVIDAGTAEISETSESLVLRRDNDLVRWMPQSGVRLYCVIAVEGRLWVGHERGLVVLEFIAPTDQQIAQARKDERPVPQPRLEPLGSVRLDGPVQYLVPLLTGRGAAYVAEFGGFGTVEVLQEEAPERSAE